MPIRPVQPSDIPAITRIYNHYIEHSTSTFEEHSLSEQQMQERIEKVTSRFPWLVTEDNGSIAGYAYAGIWKDRSAYRFCCEASIYMAPASANTNSQGRGLGSTLYSTLLHELEGLGITTVIGILTLPNDASERLHNKLGFEKVGHLERVGFKFGQWLDVGYWQKHLSGSQADQ